MYLVFWALGLLRIKFDALSPEGVLWSLADQTSENANLRAWRFGILDSRSEFSPQLLAFVIVRSVICRCGRHWIVDFTHRGRLA